MRKILCTQNHFRCTSVKIVQVKEETCMLLIITWNSGRNCTKLIWKPLVANNDLSISVLCIASFLYITQFQFTWRLPSILVHYTSSYIAALPFLINWNERWCSESNILTMDHKLILENSSSAAVYTLPNTIIYLKVEKYLNITLRRIF